MSTNTEKPNLLVFLAAGASLDLGIPSTASLTNAVVPAMVAPPGYPDSSLGGAHQVALIDALKRCYKTDAPNFEQVQHGLEALSALNRSRRPQTAAPYRVVEAELTDALHSSFPKPIDELWLYAARNEFFKSLQCAVDVPDRQVEKQPHWPKISTFFNRLDANFTLHVATTNYDLIVEKALGWRASEQGFHSVAGEKTFRYMGHGSVPRLMHLHGSLDFGYRDHGTDPNRFAFEDDHEDLYLHADSSAAVFTWGNRSGLTSMSGRDTVAGPLITGLEKSSKLLPEPYLSYYRQFQQLAIDTPRVLIVGYGFGDFHLNAIFRRLTKWHGAARRVAIIDYCEPSGFDPFSLWEFRPNLFQAASRLAEQDVMRDEFAWPDPWIPAKCADQFRLYFRGFAGTLSAHEDPLVRFLRS